MLHTNYFPQKCFSLYQCIIEYSNPLTLTRPKGHNNRLTVLFSRIYAHLTTTKIKKDHRTVHYKQRGRLLCFHIFHSHWEAHHIIPSYHIMIGPRPPPQLSLLNAHPNAQLKIPKNKDSNNKRKSCLMPLR